MNDETRDRLMAFMDGELDGLAAQRMATRLQTEKELRDSWESQHRISFLLQHGHRGVLLPSAGFADRVQQALAAEVAPEPAARAAGRFRWIGISSAAAVAVLTVSVVLFGPAGTPTRAVQVQAGAASPLRVSAVMLPLGGDRFILRPVRLFGASPSQTSEADLLIQRDIQRIWVPGQRRLLAGEAQRQELQGGRAAAQAGGLRAVRYGYPAGLGLQQTGYGAGNGNP